MKRLIDGRSTPAIRICRCWRRRTRSPPESIFGPCQRAGLLAGGIPLVFEKISTPLYRDVDVYARAVYGGWPANPGSDRVSAGVRLSEANPAPHLHMYRRVQSRRRQDAPLYDGYRGRGNEPRPLGDDRAHARRRDACHVDSKCRLHVGTGMPVRRRIRRKRFFRDPPDRLCRQRAGRLPARPLFRGLRKDRTPRGAAGISQDAPRVPDCARRHRTLPYQGVPAGSTAIRRSGC